MTLTTVTVSVILPHCPTVDVMPHSLLYPFHPIHYSSLASSQQLWLLPSTRPPPCPVAPSLPVTSSTPSAVRSLPSQGVPVSSLPTAARLCPADVIAIDRVQFISSPENLRRFATGPALSVTSGPFPLPSALLPASLGISDPGMSPRFVLLSLTPVEEGTTSNSGLSELLSSMSAPCSSATPAWSPAELLLPPPLPYSACHRRFRVMGEISRST